MVTIHGLVLELKREIFQFVSFKLFIFDFFCHLRKKTERRKSWACSIGSRRPSSMFRIKLKKVSFYINLIFRNLHFCWTIVHGQNVVRGQGVSFSTILMLSLFKYFFWFGFTIDPYTSSEFNFFFCSNI